MKRIHEKNSMQRIDEKNNRQVVGECVKMTFGISDMKMPNAVIAQSVVRRIGSAEVSSSILDNSM